MSKVTQQRHKSRPARQCWVATEASEVPGCTALDVSTSLHADLLPDASNRPAPSRRPPPPYRTCRPALQAPAPEAWGSQTYWPSQTAPSARTREHSPRALLPEALPKRVAWNRRKKEWHHGHARLPCTLEPEGQERQAGPASISRRGRWARTGRPHGQLPGWWPLTADPPSQALL